MGYNHAMFICLVCGLLSQLTDMVMLKRSVNLDPGVVSVIPAQSHTFVRMRAILL